MSACQKLLGGLVLGRAHHPRVDVAELAALDRPEPGQRAAELLGADLAELGVVLGRVHLGHDDLAVLATGAGDADHAVAGATVAGHDAAGGDGLVIRVGVHGHERVRFSHAPMIADAAQSVCGEPRSVSRSATVQRPKIELGRELGQLLDFDGVGAR